MLVFLNLLIAQCKLIEGTENVSTEIEKWILKCIQKPVKTILIKKKKVGLLNVI